MMYHTHTHTHTQSTEDIEKENAAVRDYQDSLERNSKSLAVLDKGKLNKREVCDCVCNM
jgi:hypothetical protein